MQITADSMGVYTKVFSLSRTKISVIRQWSVQWCLMAGPACLYGLGLITMPFLTIEQLFGQHVHVLVQKKTSGSILATFSDRL